MIRPEPRRWQLDALKAWSERLAGIAKVVTGGGKTIFALLCIEHFHKLHKASPAIIIVPTLALADQWFVAIQDDSGVDPACIAVFSGLERSNTLRPYNIFLLNTARDLLPRFTSSNKCMLVVDECHRIGSAQSLAIINMPWLATLGLSATPERHGDSAFVDHLLPKLGPIIADYDYKAAHADNVISDFKLVNIHVPLQKPEEREYKALSQRIFILMRKIDSGADVSQDRLKLLLIRRARVAASAAARIPTAVKLSLKHRDEKQIIFHEQVRSANAILSLLRSSGLYALGYHTRIGATVRRSNLHIFKQGISSILCSCHALDEGLNVPAISIGIIASSTASPRQRIQRLGRVLRPAKGKHTAIIYTLYSTEAEEKQLRAEQSGFAGIAKVDWMRIRI